jgi:hypothetical protein
MADGSALIAALRAGTPAALKQASGPQTLSYPWMARTEGPLVIPTRKAPVSPTPSSPTPSSPTPSVPVPFITVPSVPTSVIQQAVYTPPTETEPGMYGIPNQPIQQTDWDKLNADYANMYNQALQSGITNEQWAQTPVFENWKQTVLGGVSRTDDPNKLKSDISALSSPEALNNPIYGDWFKQLLATEQERLNMLNNLNYSYPSNVD